MFQVGMGRDPILQLSYLLALGPHHLCPCGVGSGEGCEDMPLNLATPLLPADGDLQFARLRLCLCGPVVGHLAHPFRQLCEFLSTCLSGGGAARAATSEICARSSKIASLNASGTISGIRSALA